MRFVYNLLLLLAVPLGVLHLLVRSLLRERGYRHHLAERFGFGPRVQRNTFWVHAVAFGEMQAAAPLVRELRLRHPQYEVVFTTFTPTGRARAHALFGDDADVRYVPFDLRGAVARFLDRTRPQLAVVMETELWPRSVRGLRRARNPAAARERAALAAFGGTLSPPRAARPRVAVPGHRHRCAE